MFSRGSSPGGGHDRDRGEREDDQERHQTPRSPTIFTCRAPIFLPEVLGCPPDHQTADEHRDDDVEDHAVEAAPDAAEDDLADRHVEHRCDHAEGLVGVVHRVDAAVRRVGRGDRPQARTDPARTAPPCPPCSERTPRCPPSAWPGSRCAPAARSATRPAEEQHHHRREERPALRGRCRPSCRTCR